MASGHARIIHYRGDRLELLGLQGCCLKGYMKIEYVYNFMQIVGTMTIEPFYDAATGSLSYLVVDDATQCCAVIDPVLDFDPASGEVKTHSVDAILETIHSRALKVEWVLETHVHADHLTAAQYLRDSTGAPR